LKSIPPQINFCAATSGLLPNALNPRVTHQTMSALCHRGVSFPSPFLPNLPVNSHLANLNTPNPTPPTTSRFVRVFFASLLMLGNMFSVFLMTHVTPHVLNVSK